MTPSFFFLTWYCHLQYCLGQHAEEQGYTVTLYYICTIHYGGGWVMRCCWVNFQCRGVLLIWLTVGHGPTALAVGAGVFFFLHSSVCSLLFLPLFGRRPDID